MVCGRSVSRAFTMQGFILTAIAVKCTLILDSMKILTKLSGVCNVGQGHLFMMHAQSVCQGQYITQYFILTAITATEK